MDPSRLLQLCGTLTRRTTTDERDDDDELIVTTTTATVRCWVQPYNARSASSEQIAAQNTTTAKWIGYFPAGVTIEGWDALEVCGKSYEIAGPAQPWTHPRTGSEVYQSAPLDLIR